MSRIEAMLALVGINEEYRLENLEPKHEPILKTTSLSLNFEPRAWAWA